MPSLTTTQAPKGLEGIVATTSSICYIDGDQGVLAYRGIDIHELADNSNFEETCYLLWYGKLPTKRQLDSFKSKFVANRQIPKEVLAMMMAMLMSISAAAKSNL